MVDILDFLVPDVFLNMFPIAPHFVPYVLSSIFCLGIYIDGSLFGLLCLE